MLRFPSRLPFTRCARFYSTTPEKPSLKLVAELRKRTEVSIIKAREALSASNNDVSAALDWLKKDLVTSGAKQAAKVGGRPTEEGLISVSVLPGEGVRAAMVELNCETDFVGRNDLFGRLAADIAHTAAYLAEPGVALQTSSLELLNGAPLLSATDPTKNSSATVHSAIRDMIAKVGENVSLRRAVTVVKPGWSPLQPKNAMFRVASYLHGTINTPTQGRAGALAILALRSPRLASLIEAKEFRENLQRIERSLARQIVGFETTSVDGKDEQALYNQPFLTWAGELSGEPVQKVIRHWASQQGLETNPEIEEAISVLEFARWSLGSS